MAKRNNKCKSMNRQGFQYQNKVYIWHEKELYRLPYNVNLSYYGLLKCTKWNDGYIIGSQRKSLKQLQGMTSDIKIDFEFIKSNHLPF